MKVISITNSNLKHRTPSSENYPQEFREKHSAGVCKEINNNVRGNNVAFSGGLPKMSGAAAKSLGDKILDSKLFGKVLNLAEGSPIICSSLFALGLAGILRPATIMSLPGKKDKEDKIYASGHSFASGVIGFISSIVLTTPLNQMMDKVKEDPIKYMKNFKKYFPGMDDVDAIKKTQKFINLETMVKVGCDSIVAIPRAIITIALIPPVLKYVFGLEKKKKGEPEPMLAMANSNALMAMNMQKSFQDFRGGLN